MKPIILMIICLLCISQVCALSPAIMGGITAASASNNVPATGQTSGGCTPPIQFSIENSCTLEYYDRWSVNEYTCGNMIVTGDCKGGVIALRQLPGFFDGFDPTPVWAMLVVLIIFLIFIVYLKYKYRRKDDGLRRWY